MYFDVVLTEDMQPVFNDTPEEVCEWLRTHTIDVERDNLEVCEGETMRMYTVSEYLTKHGVDV
jgi:hypothetical protein